MPSRRVRNNKTQWVAQVSRQEFRKQKICGSKKEAVAWEMTVNQLLDSGVNPLDLERLLREGTPPERIQEALERMKTPSVSLLEWANDYLAYAQRFSEKTRGDKRDCFRNLVKRLGPHTLIEEVTAGVALDYLQHHYKKRSGHAANKERKNLVAAWNWGIKYRGFPAPNPFQLVDQFPHDANPHYVPPLEDFWKVFDVAEGQDRVMLLTFLHTAGRRGEIYRLKWEDVDFIRRRIRLYTRKRMGGSLESDWMPMTDELAEVLQAHNASAMNEWVFVAQELKHYGNPFKVRRHWPKNLCKLAGVRPFGCHGIRGLASSILAQKDVPMKVIQEMLRHKSLSTTERYVRGLTSIRPYLKVLEGGRSKQETQTPFTSDLLPEADNKEKEASQSG